MLLRFFREVHVLRCVLIKFTTFDQDVTCMHAIELNAETFGELTLPSILKPALSHSKSSVILDIFLYTC
jgi:hypothetical protein